MAHLSEPLIKPFLLLMLSVRLISVAPLLATMFTLHTKGIIGYMHMYIYIQIANTTTLCQSVVEMAQHYCPDILHQAREISEEF